MSRLGDEAQLKKLFEVLAERYADRDGGYTRVLRAGIRASDAVQMAIIELVDRDEAAKGQDSGPVQSEDEYEDA
jgi:large subunit ribosomal protein L17